MMWCRQGCCWPSRQAGFAKMSQGNKQVSKDEQASWVLQGHLMPCDVVQAGVLTCWACRR